MLQELLESFVVFFTVIDPIGTIPVFIAVTATVDRKKRAGIARKATLVAAGVLLFFILIGEIILDAINIPLSAFQIAGGIVLLLFALTMIFGESKPEREIEKVGRESDKSVFPLAIPSLASPGAILAAIMLTENSTHDATEQSLVAVTMLAVMLIAWIFMLAANQILKIIGNSGAAIISRVMGLILAAVAVSNMLQGVSSYFGL